MAGKSKSGASGGLSGFQVPRRSVRARKPRVYDNFVPNFESPSRTRGMVARNGSRPSTGDRPRPLATGARQRDQGQRDRVSTRHYDVSESESDDDYSEEEDGSDTLENLEELFDDLSRATREGMADLELIIKIILSVMPDETIRKISTYARTSDKKDSIEYFLRDLIRFNNENTNNRGLSPGSVNAAAGEMDLRQGAAAGPEPGPGPLALGLRET